jgi:Carboxylesterase family
MQAAYRTFDDGSDGSNIDLAAEQANSTFNTPFQRILNHFFGDYFKEDADEEIASDMADRWVEFARTGDPNYEGSRAQWRPWRYVLDEALGRDTGRAWEPEDFDAIFNLERYAEEGDNETVMDAYAWSDDPEFLLYRRRALKALEMQIVDEDVYQTMLRRIPRANEEAEHPLQLLFGGPTKLKGKEVSAQKRLSRRAKRQLQEIAQDMGVLGTGLKGEPWRSGVGDMWEEEFFPEMLELKWPPEGRLIERDCTCDMWERIRCKLLLLLLMLWLLMLQLILSLSDADCSADVYILALTLHFSCCRPLLRIRQSKRGLFSIL